MKDARKLIAVLDANVLYPAPLRDFLLHMASVDLFDPKWTAQIHDEWIRNLLLNRCDLRESQLNRTRQAMDDAFPEALITGYKSIISSLNLPDKDDRHILAAGIKCRTDLIITFNRKDFPSKVTRQYDIEPQTPDEFIVHCLKTNPTKVIEALLNQVNSLRNPPQTVKQVLTTLEKCGLEKSIAIIGEWVS